MTYKSLALIGFSWTALLRVCFRSTAFIKIAILARLLSPQDFGTFGVAVLALGLLEMLTETGINVFLLQLRSNFLNFINTAWIVSILRGILIAAIIFSISPLIGVFFQSPDAVQILLLTSAIPLIRGFINPSSIRFLKELEFKKEFFYRFAIILSEISTSIILALIFRSPVALVASLIVSAFVEVLLSFLFIRPHPKLKFSSSQAREIVNHGKWVTAFGLFDYLFTQSDNIAVGRLLGSASLGIYQNAYKLATLPITEINDIYYRVNFPVYSSLLTQNNSIRRIVYKNALSVSIFCIILGVLIYLFSDIFVLVVLGSAWTEAIPIVRILAFVAPLRVISFAFNPLFMALGKQKWVSYIIGTGAFAMLICLLPLTKMYGMTGASLSALIGAISSLPVTLYYTSKAIRTIK